MRIARSKFVAGIQCVERLYWQVHKPQVAAKPNGSSQARISQGDRSGCSLTSVFRWVAVDDSRGLEHAIRDTRELVSNREVPAIFGAPVEHGRVLVQVDMLQRQRDDGWRLLEVKSTTDLPRMHFSSVAKLEGIGIVSIYDIPDDFPLTSSSTVHHLRVF
jgi:hypothetical protein